MRDRVSAVDTGDGRKADALGVRTGIHPGYTRVVFDWTTDVDFTVDKNGDVATIAFSKSATPDLSGINARPPRWIRAANARGDNDRLIVDIEVAADARLRHFRSGTKAVIDVLGAGPARAAESAPAADAEAANVTAPQQERVAPRAVAVAEKADPEPAGSPGDTAAAPEELQPMRLLPPELEAEGRPDGAGASQAEPSSASTGALAVRFGGEAGRLQLAFDWTRPVGAAVFARSGHLWVVFDDPATASFDPIPEGLADVLFLAEQLSDPSATALRFKLRPGLHPAVSRRAESWEIDFGPAPKTPEQPLTIQRRAGRAGSSVLVSAAAQRIFAIRDPEVGDTLAVAPLREPGQGIAARHAYAQFAILPSAQGVAVTRLADGIGVEAAPGGIATLNGFGAWSRDGVIAHSPVG